jgi:hypothetical protein
MANKKVGLVKHPQLININHSILLLFAIHILVQGPAHYFFERTIFMAPLAIYLGTGSTQERKHLFAAPIAK